VCRCVYARVVAVFQQCDRLGMRSSIPSTVHVGPLWPVVVKTKMNPQQHDVPNGQTLRRSSKCSSGRKHDVSRVVTSEKEDGCSTICDFDRRQVRVAQWSCNRGPSPTHTLLYIQKIRKFDRERYTTDHARINKDVVASFKMLYGYLE
jgi:hypothetical protein